MRGVSPARSTTTSDSLGRFRVLVPREYFRTLLVRARGFRPGVAELSGSAVPLPPTILLEAGSTLRGSVTDAEGEPVAGARVVVLPRDALQLDPVFPLGEGTRPGAELGEGWFLCDDAFQRALTGWTDNTGWYEIP